jgi:hypothetical protein
LHALVATPTRLRRLGLFVSRFPDLAKDACGVPVPVPAEAPGGHGPIAAKSHVTSPSAGLEPEVLSVMRALVGGDVRYGGCHDVCMVGRHDDGAHVTARFVVGRRTRFSAV